MGDNRRAGKSGQMQRLVHDVVENAQDENAVAGQFEINEVPGDPHPEATRRHEVDRAGPPVTEIVVRDGPVQLLEIAVGLFFAPPPPAELPDLVEIGFGLLRPDQR